jgi:ABC-type sugar transport system permease subunit
MSPVVLGLLVHLALRPLLDPWLNASSDAKVATAIAILLLPIAFSAVMLLRALQARPD